MSIDSQSHSDYRFVLGIVAGSLVGAGLMMLFAPARGTELRQRLGSAIDSLVEETKRVRVGVADTVANKAHDVEEFATAAAMRAGSRQL